MSTYPTPHYNKGNLIGYRINNVIEGSNLTTTPMSVFFTLTFPNVLRKTCFECQEHFLLNGYDSHLKGNSNKGLRDVAYNYHSHFPSYSFVISRARNLATFYGSKNTQIVVEGDPDYLKKYDSYMDEHKLRPLFSEKDNSRVTRPHVHGLIKNIDKDNFYKSLEKSNYYDDYWQKGCSCFYPTIEKNNDWVYRKKPLMEFVDGKCHDINHLVPKKERKPIGFHKIEQANNEDRVENYIRKYIDKGGHDVRLF